MRRPVQKRIQKIAQKESGKESPGVIAVTQKRKNYIKYQKQHGRHDQTWHRRHQQPFCVPGVQVMRPVHDEVKTLDKLVVRDPVEQIAVQQILREGPRE